MENIRWSFFVAVSILAFVSKSQGTAGFDFQFQMMHQIRLVGETPFKGRLEVFYGGEWGTVCDDNFTPYGCELVCRQLGFWNGTCISIVSSDCLAKQNGDFELGSGRIWLDDVRCTGYELRLDECQHSPWGKINCFHDEDVGCVCTPHRDQCNSSRHRIIPLDSIHSAIGVVEVQDEEGVWGAVCDDHWDDFDAIIFCKCLGYKDTASFRALSMGRPIPTLSNYRGSFIFDEVHCPHGDSFFTRNLWDCETKMHRPSKCDIRSELALVQCENNGADLLGKEPDRTNVSVLCDGINLTVCVQPLFEFDVRSAEVGIHPPCTGAKLKSYDDDLGFCYHINLIQCPPLETNKMVEGLKNYCYDISLEVPNNLFFLGGLTKRGCCSLNKSLQVEAIFPASRSSDVEEETNSFASKGVKPKLSIPCFQEDSSKLLKISEGDVVDRGSTIHCNVVADVWDDDLQLVVQNCKFFSSSEDDAAAHVFSYTFIEDKCVVTDLLNVKLFNGGRHFWGLSFYLPKFESVDKVSLTCDVFLCDVKRDGKQLCDRSCDFNNSKNFITDTTTSSNVSHSTSPIPLKDALKIVADESDDLPSKPYLTDADKFKDETQKRFFVPPSRRRRRRSLRKHVIEAGNDMFILVKDTGEGPLILKTGLLVIEKSRLQSLADDFFFVVLLQLAAFVTIVLLSVHVIRRHRR